MVQKKAYKRLVSFLEANGFTHDRTNAKDHSFYRHANHPEVSVGLSISEGAARQIEARICKALGIATVAEQKKRDAAAIKERAAADRVQARAELARLNTERAQLLAQRDEALARFGVSDSAQMRALVERIEQNERDQKHWATLMTETPTSGHKGVEHAKHRA